MTKQYHYFEERRGYHDHSKKNEDEALLIGVCGKQGRYRIPLQQYRGQWTTTKKSTQKGHTESDCAKPTNRTDNRMDVACSTWLSSGNSMDQTPRLNLTGMLVALLYGHDETNSFK